MYIICIIGCGLKKKSPSGENPGLEVYAKALRRKRIMATTDPIKIKDCLFDLSIFWIPAEKKAIKEAMKNTAPMVINNSRFCGLNTTAIDHTANATLFNKRADPKFLKAGSGRPLNFIPKKNVAKTL